MITAAVLLPPIAQQVVAVGHDIEPRCPLDSPSPVGKATEFQVEPELAVERISGGPPVEVPFVNPRIQQLLTVGHSIDPMPLLNGVSVEGYGCVVQVDPAFVVARITSVLLEIPIVQQSVALGHDTDRSPLLDKLTPDP